MLDPSTHFNARLTNLDENIWRMIARIDEMKGRWHGGNQGSQSFQARLRRSVLITSTGASTRIEGARLTDEEVEKIMRGLSVAKFRERDVQEVSGYFEVLENIFDSYETLSLREGGILHLHKALLQYAENDEQHRGNYKRKENAVGIQNAAGEVEEILFETTPAWLVQKEMTEIIEWTYQALERKELHPLLVIGNFLVEFLKIHPFEDGNGRLSRILTNLLLLRAGYHFMPYASHEQIVEQRKEAYYLALRQSQSTFKTEHPSIVPWLQFFLGVVEEQGLRALALLATEHLEDVLSPKQLEVWQIFMVSQEVSAGEIEKQTNIARPTVNQALTKLLRLNKIKRIGQGRAIRYQKCE